MHTTNRSKMDFGTILVLFSLRFFGQIFLNGQLGDDKKRDVHRSAEGKGTTDLLIN